jgi:cytochrome c oxidase subunit 2
MRISPAARRRFRRLLPLLGLALLVLAGCAENYPQTTLAPKGDFARAVDALFRSTVRWAVVVFVLVEGALIYAILRYRSRPGGREPSQFHGNALLEVIWTVIPAAILVFIAVPTVRTIFRTAEEPAGDALVIEVIGHQWWWEFRYPELNITTASEMFVPVGRPVDLRMRTADVLHSFWVPQLAAKRDVFYGRDNRMWFTAEEAGVFPGQCAEFCGIQHGKMAHRVIALEPADFDTWVSRMSAANAPVPVAEDDSLALEGQALFTSRACAGCHALQAVGAPTGLIGPNLANIGARLTIAAGSLENTDANLARWLRNPQEYKEGVQMPNLGLSENEITALVAYLRTQRVAAVPPALAAAAP